MFHVKYICIINTLVIHNNLVNIIAAGDFNSLFLTCGEKRNEEVSIFENKITSFI